MIPTSGKQEPCVSSAETPRFVAPQYSYLSPMPSDSPAPGQFTVPSGEHGDAQSVETALYPTAGSISEQSRRIWAQRTPTPFGIIHTRCSEYSSSVIPGICPYRKEIASTEQRPLDPPMPRIAQERQFLGHSYDFWRTALRTPFTLYLQGRLRTPPGTHHPI
jgi:hypothetical protein